jgi:beta-lactamase superfamily II metal-dependent hydrolase
MGNKVMSNEIGYEVDFLAVGDGKKSGDAIAMRWGNLLATSIEQTVIVIDGGFSDSGDALVEHIRKYYKTEIVDYIISTHPDGDHVSGLRNVIEQLTVKNLIIHQPWNHIDGISEWFQDGRVTDNSVKERLKNGLETAYELEQLAIEKGIQIYEPFVGLTGFNGAFRVIGPTQEYYEELLLDFRSTPEPARDSLLGKFAPAAGSIVSSIREAFDYETLDDSGETSAENNSSAIILFTFDDKYLLFTGDAGIPALTSAINSLDNDGLDLSKIKFIQIPHHGSKRNIGPTLLDRIIGEKLEKEYEIKTAFVSAAKDGLPKHPAKKVTNAFRRRGALVYATQGYSIWHHHNTPKRDNYSTIEAIPFYDEVDE